MEICDSLRSRLSRVSRKNVNVLYKNCATDARGKIIVSFLPVCKHNDDHNSGVYAIAFAAEILNNSPIEARFHVERMRPHIIQSFGGSKLTPFSKCLINDRCLETLDVTLVLLKDLFM